MSVDRKKRNEEQEKRRKEQRQFEARIRELLPMLQSDNPNIRSDAWDAIARTLKTQRGSLSRALVLKLVNIQLDEEDDRVWKVASRVIPLVQMRCRVRPRRRRNAHSVVTLGDWLWQGFHDRSRVMRVADPRRLRRDEEAVIAIARSLSLAEFAETEFVCIDPDGFAPLDDDLAEIGALCFVGRLCLYGTDAVDRWGPVDGPQQYRFGMDFRPDGLPRGELHPEYHSVIRKIAGRDGERFPTEQPDGVRTDYGLVRRYVVEGTGGSHICVHIAGSSSLGTLGAAKIAAHRLFRPDVHGRIIPAPPEIGPNSCMETLVKVTADLKGSEYGWKVRDLEILTLRVDDSVWNEKDYCWKPFSHDTIVLRFANATAKRDYRTQKTPAVDIYVGDQKATFNRGSENHRLCIGLLMLGSEREGIVPLDELGCQNWIWKDGKPRDAKQVRARMNNHIQKKLGTSFIIEGETCRVIPEICVETDVPKHAR